MIGLLTKTPDIIFPNLGGLSFEKINKVAFNLFGISIYWYSIIIMLGVVAGYLTAIHIAKKTGQDTELYSDFLVPALIGCIIAARIYYVIFSFDEYKDNLWEIFYFRSGGLAIYGAVIAAVIIAILYNRKKKYNFFLFADTGVYGLLAGQIVGRLGNFVNKEVFGEYTNNILAMQLKLSQVDKRNVTDKIMENIVQIGGVQYIQVHPTFLYEMLWNIGILTFILLYRKHKRFVGEIFCIYLAGYGIGRFWIEGIRTDQLKLFSTGIPASQMLSALLAIASISIIIYVRYKKKKGEINK